MCLAEAYTETRYTAIVKHRCRLAKIPWAVSNAKRDIGFNEWVLLAAKEVRGVATALYCCTAG